MYVEVTKNNGTDYLRLVQSRRITNSKGVKTATKQVVLNIGPLKKFDDGKPDYVERLKKSFKDGNPLIPELSEYVEERRESVEYKVTFKEGDPSCFGDPKRFASCILDPLFSAIGLDELLASIKFSSDIQYDLQGLVRLLTYGRILEPASKIATVKQNEEYYKPLFKSSNGDNVYDALDVIYENRRKIIQRMNTNIARGTGRKSDTVFYDVTNFFFETDDPDICEEGEDKNLRQMGVSKENRKQPIVQLGLFLDRNGIPISLEVFPGNTLDHLTLRTAMKNTINTLDLDRFILVADRGMYSGTNTCHVTEQGNGYIVSKSLRKTSKKELEWALSEDDMEHIGKDFKYKSRVITRTVTDENGNKKKIQEKVVVYWSRAFYEKERHENKVFLDFIEKLKANPSGFRVSAAQSKSLRKFMKKDVLNKDTGEVLDSRRLLSLIDEDKLNEFNELMGYYQIVSSELDMDAKEIIGRYHELTRIEDQFREMKSTLETRPVYVRTNEHIYAHLMVCFIALTLMRLIQYKITNKAGYKLDKEWSYGIPGARISKALLNWKVDKLPGDLYRMENVQNEDIQTILKAFGIDVQPQLFTSGELRKLKSQVKVF